MRLAVISGYAHRLQRRILQREDDPGRLAPLVARLRAQIDLLIAQVPVGVAAVRSENGGRTMGEASEEPRYGDHKHVFAVNGSPDFLDLIRVLLQDERYNVTTTNFVPRTFDQIAALQPDLLLVDLVVSQRVGWELLEHLHAEAVTRGIPMIITSTDPGLLGRARQEQARYGGQRLLAMPFDLEDLLTAIHELIGRAEADDQGATTAAASPPTDG